MERQKDSRKIGKGDKKAESQRAIEKEEITSTEFSEGRNTIYIPKEPLGIQTGDSFEKEWVILKLMSDTIQSITQSNGSYRNAEHS